ncbi:TDP-N-acetylfucosamine:lipid II N-acetylfucosaminyltransferase [Anabaena sphaerica FACHB-251]|uniref:TDP-N-acetylfucosamine:lipid II N-acetylfucosaminyltransferase n=1 Tax=Anabaena sphaerica FACHB-251 TaxID=2692883 RepID=A0A926WCM9_9NOST|nr:TDP-N-acetylfucosamine:lipid II N-acetylfucosaminyltransferase [Anabaena sphaerica]MBD2292140.1 TDP-N-acetylfucosamine:lipid II N-acetylfucosaminyltransferase [Anabaena sphaerica FACHB-251]
MKNKIIHCYNDSPIASDFLDFMLDNFPHEIHYHFVLQNENKYFKEYQLSYYKKLNNIFSFIDLLRICLNCDIIIIHGFFSPRLVLFYLLNPLFMLKSYWVIWGEDLHSLDSINAKNIGNYLLLKIVVFFKKNLLRRVKGVITYITGDYEDACLKLNTNLNYYKCIMYPSNVYKHIEEIDNTNFNKSTINIQIGNSASSNNNHLQLFDILEPYKDQDIKIICPLSYGSEIVKERVIAKGKKIFGEKFIPITTFMSLEEYRKFQLSIDIAVFNHNRQEAMGNTISLLGMGKKVYMRTHVSQWQLFKELGIEVYDTQEFEITLMDENTRNRNIQKIQEYFSEENLLYQLEQIFN